MRNNLWYEMAQTRYGSEYLALFLDCQKRRKKCFQISIILLSTGGIMGWKIWEYAPQIACGISAAAELFQLIGNQYILKNENLDQLSILRIKYLQYSNHLEKLWLEFEQGNRNEIEVKKIYYDFKDKEYIEIQKIENNLDIPHIEELIKKTSRITKEYLTTHFINQ